MSPASELLDGLSEEAVWRLEEACCRFEEAWKAGGRPAPWDFLGDAAEAERTAVVRELLRLDVCYRRQAGDSPTLADYQALLQEHGSVVKEVLAAFAETAGATIDDLGNRSGQAVEPPTKGA